MFEVVRIDPIYSAITDAVVGSEVGWRSHGYHVEGLAHKIADRKHKEDYDNFGDSSFAVVPAGMSPFSNRLYPAQRPLPDWDCPF